MLLPLMTPCLPDRVGWMILTSENKEWCKTGKKVIKCSGFKNDQRQQRTWKCLLRKNCSCTGEDAPCLRGFPFPHTHTPSPSIPSPAGVKKPTGLPVRGWFGLGAWQSSMKLKGDLLETRELWKGWNNMLCTHSWLAAEQHGTPQGAQAKLKAWGDLFISCEFEWIFLTHTQVGQQRGEASLAWVVVV